MMVDDSESRSRVRDTVEITLLRLVALPVRILPRRAALAIGGALGLLAWWTRLRRGLVMANLRRALPAASQAERRQVGRRAARNFGRTCAEFLRFAGRDRERVAELVAFEGLEGLRDVVADGDGALVVTAHLGAWALYVTGLAAAGIPSSLLVGKQRNPHVDQLILGIPGDAVQFISKGKQAPRRILESLRDGKVVVMVADHYSSSQRVWAPFLGHPASTLPLPGALLAKHRRPLFLMSGVRGDAGRHRVAIRRLEVPDHLEGDDLRLEVAVLCNRELGREILAHPDQYWWYHQRWKVRGVPDGAGHVLGEPPQV
jgi:KDO2-lipid IV(A) lauroyltransferase